MYTLVKGQYLGSGTYDLEVEVKDADNKTIGTYQPAFIDLYSADSGQVRWGLHRSYAIDPVLCERAGIVPSSLPEGLEMGEHVICEGDSVNAEKVIRGDRDRTAKSVKCTFKSVLRQRDFAASDDRDLSAVA